MLNSMKLTLIRHAKAKHRGPSDHERKLSKVGRRQVTDLRPRLKKVVIPDIVLHSDAARTTQTAQQLKFDCDNIGLKELYVCSVEQFVDIIKQYGQENTVVVGHEPVISSVAYYLTGDPEVYYGIPTATAVVMHSVEGPADIGEGSCQIDTILYAPARDFK